MEMENDNRKRVLILCSGNSARSQMAEGLLRHLAGERFLVESAGVDPTSVRPEVVSVMAELGINISSHRSKSVNEFVGSDFDYVITVCDHANEQCPVFPGTNRLHWSFPDPAKVTGTEAAVREAFRNVRDKIRSRLELFLAEEASSNDFHLNSTFDGNQTTE
jgi:arsenate reductase